MHAYAEGVTHVIINGEVVFESGAMTAARPGRVLYGPSYQRVEKPRTQGGPGPTR